MMNTFCWPHRACFDSVFIGDSVELFLCVIPCCLLNAFGAVSSGKSSGPSFSCRKFAASFFFSGCNDAHFARKISASISLAQAQFFAIFSVSLSLFNPLRLLFFAVFICLVEKCCGNFGRRFLRPGKVWGLVLLDVRLSLVPEGGQRTG